MRHVGRYGYECFCLCDSFQFRALQLKTLCGSNGLSWNAALLLPRFFLWPRLNIAATIDATAAWKVGPSEVKFAYALLRSCDRSTSTVRARRARTLWRFRSIFKIIHPGRLD